MKKTFLALIVFALMVSCTDAKKPDASTVEATKSENKPAPENPPKSATASAVDDAAIATIDVNGVIIKLHQLIKFEPKGNQFLKADNTNFDYYIMDLSIDNTTAATINAGTDFDFFIDIESKDGKRFLKIDPSAKVLSLYEMEVSKKDQSAYDKLWSKIAAGEKVRSLFRGYEAPKNITPQKFIYDNPAKGIKKEQSFNL
jgi:hypothetical protein